MQIGKQFLKANNKNNKKIKIKSLKCFLMFKKFPTFLKFLVPKMNLKTPKIIFIRIKIYFQVLN